jgi:hypothetical protein
VESRDGEVEGEEYPRPELKRRKLKLKANLETSSSHFSFKR